MASFDFAQFQRCRSAVGTWISTLQQQRNLLAQILREHRIAGRKLLGSAINIPYAEPRWTLLPLPDSVNPLLGVRDRYTSTEFPSMEHQQFGRLVLDSGVRAHHDSAPLDASKPGILNPRMRAQAEKAAQFLIDLHAKGLEIGFDKSLEHAQELRKTTPDASLADALDPKYALRELLTLEEEKAADLDVINLDQAEFADLSAIVNKLDVLARDLNQLRTASLKISHELREKAASERVRSLDIDYLKDVSRERLKLSVLKENSLLTVGQLMDLRWKVGEVSGIGEATASNIVSATRALNTAILEETPVRIDVANRTSEQTQLLRAIYTWQAAHESIGHKQALSFAAAIKARAYHVSGNAARLIVVGRGRPATDFVALVRECRELAAQYNGLGDLPAFSDDDVWSRFARQPAQTYALMAEIGILTSDSKKIRGELPEEIATKVQETQIDTDLLTANLRGYQKFGARFVLSQGKVVLGDEMGLGKTLEALAVLAHLYAQGKRYSIVVCPAAVVTNWLREIAAKTELSGYRIHGANKHSEALLWQKNGGIAVTTFETLAWFEGFLRDAKSDVVCTVVDEAHYIKNPDAKRSLRTARLIAQARYAVLLTGTPMENRIDEFRHLIRYIRPDLAIHSSVLPKRFRKQVAPAYLRRNQEDVLNELPELVEIEDWLPMSKGDREIYENAVRDGNFMAMRQAAMLSSDSTKIERLRQIVDEAKENGHRVIIYSYFLTAMNRLREEFPQAFGPLTGSVSSVKRQEIVDDFSNADAGAVLLAQIVAGGVGLNIQSASVVIICEPQLKPTTEWQAIARAHRMGQLESVQVHRLITEEGVDERLFAVLHRKSELFESFAKVSLLAQTSSEATESDALDATALPASEAQLAHSIVEREQERLFGS
ncbi:ERCC4-related helicase [Arcanobacterium pluranimalium]|uniref:DEAD/DEAH box helicase n=1 Tax=Arcanobacterium pluranimalium TaxID=108028 RepID=UPI00195ADE8F|nr:DEAD/DEAH box helicase [Arcanobacterium pluranimalium]MBM7824758.1 ERCC4-related helicase [Arcanobacterium pluranimalium]